MSDLVRALQQNARAASPRFRLVDAITSGPNEVDGVALPHLIPVGTGVRVQLLKQGDAPGLILGPVGTSGSLAIGGGLTVGGRHFIGGGVAGWMLRSGTATETTDAFGNVTYSLPSGFASAPRVWVQPLGTTAQRAATMLIKDTTHFRVKITDNSGNVASTAVTVDWIAHGPAA